MPKKQKCEGGNSSKHREAENEMLATLSEKLGLSLQPQHVLNLEGSKVEVDGHYETETVRILVEVFARLGKPKAGQMNKILKDAFKLLFVAESLAELSPKKTDRRILLFCDKQVLNAVKGQAWCKKALEKFQIEPQLVEISSKLHTSLADETRRQAAEQSDI